MTFIGFQVAKFLTVNIVSLECRLTLIHDAKLFRIEFTEFGNYGRITFIVDEFPISALGINKRKYTILLRIVFNCRLH